MYQSLLAEQIDEVAASAASQNSFDIAAAFGVEAKRDGSEDIWKLLQQVLDMHFRPWNTTKPFGPMVQLEDGRRSLVPSDLDNSQVDCLSNFLLEVQSASLISRIGDVLWVARKDAKAARLAVPAYIETGVILEDPIKWPPCMECYERAVRLARLVGGKGEQLRTMPLQHLLGRVLYYKGTDLSFFSLSAIRLLNGMKFGDPLALSEFVLSAAKNRKRTGQPSDARSYFDLAARLAARGGRLAEAEHAKIESALTWVAEADREKANGRYLAETVFIKNAVNACRTIPKLKSLQSDLQWRLRIAGSDAVKHMNTFSTPLDFGDVSDKACNAVSGLNYAHSIYTLCLVSRGIIPSALRERVIKQMTEAPLSYVANRIFFDRTGRIIDNPPSLNEDDEEQREQAWFSAMAHEANLERQIAAEAQIRPALSQLRREHAIDVPKLLSLMGNGQLIPMERQTIFVKGLAAGFNGDMITSIHLLIPQVEYAVRKLLINKGIVTSSVAQNELQEDWGLGTVLYSKELVGALPESLIFELSSLLIFKGGPDIRNRLCHGMLAEEEFDEPSMLYFWWLMLRASIICTDEFKLWFSNCDTDM